MRFLPTIGKKLAPASGREFRPSSTLLTSAALALLSAGCATVPAVRVAPPENLRALRIDLDRPALQAIRSPGHEELAMLKFIEAASAATSPLPVHVASAILLAAGNSCKAAATPFVQSTSTSLRKRQSNEGTWQPPGSADAMRSHALATLALASVGEISSVARATEALLTAQQPGGGWASSMGPVQNPDVESTALALLALRAAWRTGITNDAIPAALLRGASALAEFQDPDSGAFGLQSRNFAGWTSTGMAILGLQTASLGMTQPARRGFAALLRTDVRQRRAQRHDLLDILLLRVALHRHGGFICQRIEKDILPDLLRFRRPDGSWPSPSSPRGSGDLYTTAIASLALHPEKISVLLGPPPPSPRPLTATVNDPATAATILIAPPAEPADTIMINDDLLALAAKSRPILGYDPFALETALIKAACDSSTGHPRPWAATIGASLAHEDLRHIRLGTLPDFILEFMAQRPVFLLAPDEIAAATSRFNGDTGKTIVSEFCAAEIPAAIVRAREAWAQADEPAMTTAIESSIPSSLRPDIATLRRLAAERLAAEIVKPGNSFVILDAWLALGPDGVLARLRATRPTPP